MTSTESSKSSSDVVLEHSDERDVELPEQTDALELEAEAVDTAKNKDESASDGAEEEEEKDSLSLDSDKPSVQPVLRTEIDSFYGRPGGIDFSDDDAPPEPFQSSYGDLSCDAKSEGSSDISIEAPVDFAEDKKNNPSNAPREDIGSAFGSPVPTFLGPLSGPGAAVISPVPQGATLLSTPLPPTANNEKSEAIDDLADAVQNALRNIYGPDLMGSSSTILAASQTRRLDFLTANDAGLRIEEPAQPWNPMPRYDSHDARSGSVAEIDETTTEAVLSYLYNHDTVDLRSSLSRDSHYQDDAGLDKRLQPRNGYPQYWEEQRAESDSMAIESKSYSSYAVDTPYHRSPATHAPAQMPPQPSEPSLRSFEPRGRGGEAAASPQVTSVPALQTAYSSSATQAQMQERESGRLLGAAGLGLIGGIALAGVMSVFLFNSFVTKPNPGESENYLPPAASGSSDITSANVAAKPDEPFKVADVSGQAGRPIPLNIEVNEQFKSDDTLFSLKGLPGQGRLSAGIDAGGGMWLLPTQRVPGLQLTLPPTVAGSVKLEAQLMQADGRTPLSEPKSFTINIDSAGKSSSPASDGISQDAVTKALAVMQGNTDRMLGVAAAPPPSTDGISGQRTGAITPGASSANPARPSNDPIKSQQLVRDGNKLMREGDILGARKLYEQAYKLGDVDGALAMGRSYDPSYFEQLQVKTGTPDPAQAFEWYRKALDGGVESARLKIDSLKQWLLR